MEFAARSAGKIDHGEVGRFREGLIGSPYGKCTRCLSFREELNLSTRAAASRVEVAEEIVHDLVSNDCGEVERGHQSRNRCFARVAQQLSRHPGGTLADTLSAPNDYSAMDRLMNRSAVTHERVLAPHPQRTLAKRQAHAGVVLVLHDTTVLDDAKRKKRKRARVGNGHGRG